MPEPSSTSAAAFPPAPDPNDEGMGRLIQFPLGTLATLLYMAERADATGALPPCDTLIDGEFCSFCSALQDADTAMEEHGVRVNGHG